MALSSHQSARMKNDEWLTPPEILAALGSFDLDPCAPVNRPWATAAKHYTVADNGLAMPWHGRVWCNPPFGREAAAWLARMAEHGNGVALIPARTETAMFYASVWGAADGVLFIKGRPHFHYVDGRRAAFNSGAPIALVAYGRENLNALCDSGLGFVVVGHNARIEPGRWPANLESNMEWQPIETIPTDGRRVLVYRPLAEKTGDRQIEIKRAYGGKNMNCWKETVPDGATPTNPTDGLCHATHWAPLPSPPAA